MTKRILTGDRPTGRLHLGHYVGSLINRVRLQSEFDTVLIIADLHMLTTKASKEDIANILPNARGIVADYIGAGIDPQKATIYLQSGVPEVAGIAQLLQSLVTVNRLSRLPSLKDMARDANIDENSISFALLGYPVLQSADILGPKANVVPVGKDNEAHVEITREIARRFNGTYEEVFPIPEVMLSDTPSLVGLDGGAKMSKSLGNCIFLNEDPRSLEKKVNSIFTDPNRLRADIPGRVEGNVLFVYHDTFNPNRDEVKEFKHRYREGRIGDKEIKARLLEVLTDLLRPIQERMREAEQDSAFIDRILLNGIDRVRSLAAETLRDMRTAMGLQSTLTRLRRSVERADKKTKATDGSQPADEASP
jgi:tryptophanyl-tRNA synthetase